MSQQEVIADKPTQPARSRRSVNFLAVIIISLMVLFFVREHNTNKAMQEMESKSTYTCEHDAPGCFLTYLESLGVEDEEIITALDLMPAQSEPNRLVTGFICRDTTGTSYYNYDLSVFKSRAQFYDMAGLREYNQDVLTALGFESVKMSRTWYQLDTLTGNEALNRLKQANMNPTSNGLDPITVLETWTPSPEGTYTHQTITNTGAITTDPATYLTAPAEATAVNCED